MGRRPQHECDLTRPAELDSLHEGQGGGGRHGCIRHAYWAGFDFGVESRQKDRRRQTWDIDLKLTMCREEVVPQLQHW